MNNTKLDTLKVEFSFYDIKTGASVTDKTLKKPDMSEELPDRGTIGLDLELFINGEKIKGYIDSYILYPNHQDNKERFRDYKVENKALYEAESGDSDSELDVSDDDYSNFYVVSCSCGEAGCAGIWCGIFIRREDGKLIWTVPAGEGYEEKTNLRIGEYVFDEKEYEKTFEEALKRIEEKIKAEGWSPEAVEMQSMTNFNEFLEYAKKHSKKEAE